MLLAVSILIHVLSFHWGRTPTKNKQESSSFPTLEKLLPRLISCTGSEGLVAKSLKKLAQHFLHYTLQMCCRLQIPSCLAHKINGHVGWCCPKGPGDTPGYLKSVPKSRKAAMSREVGPLCALSGYSPLEPTSRQQRDCWSFLLSPWCR